MGRKELPTHWTGKGDLMFIRVDGVVVQIALEERAKAEYVLSQEKRRIGWAVRLPIGVMNNGMKYEDHFLAAEKYPTVGELLRKVDQEWGPPDHIKPLIPPGWLGEDLERLAREAPSMNAK
jgi:hypothetical protein